MYQLIARAVANVAAPFSVCLILQFADRRAARRECPRIRRVYIGNVHVQRSRPCSVFIRRILAHFDD